MIPSEEHSSESTPQSSESTPRVMAQRRPNENFMLRDRTTFRIKNKRVHLIYHGHLDKTTLRTQFQNRFQFARLEIAHETKDGDEHTHVLIDFGRVFESRNRNVFQFQGRNPHIGIKIATAAHWKNCLEYLGKQDRENVHLRGNSSRDSSQGKSFAEQVWEQPTIQSALIVFGNKVNVNSIVKYYEYRPKVPQQRKLSHFTWQNELIARLVTQEPDDRTIQWYSDKKGGAGKTELCTYLHCMYPTQFWLLTEFRTMSDIATVLFNACKTGWDGHAVLLDVPRQMRDFDVVYTAIETIKNGILTVSKYQSQLLTLPKRPHVVVLSNSLPDVTMLSLDKWELYELVHSNGNERGKPQDVTARPVSVDSLLPEENSVRDEHSVHDEHSVPEENSFDLSQLDLN